jgi:hypothetical protein
VRVRLSRVEAAVAGEAAGRAGMSVGAWVGNTAVNRARAEAARDELDEAGGTEPSSWRELVAALVALRAEVAAARRVPVVEFETGAPVGELPDGEPSHGAPSGAGRGGVVELLRRIDTVIAAVVEATSSSVRRTSPRSTRCSRDHEGGARVAAGRTAGLPAGPGTVEVHQAPRVIASWDGLDAGW